MPILTALLAAEELYVSDLALALEVNEDAVSYGFRVLRRHGLVERRAAGRMGFYRLTDEHLQSALSRRYSGSSSRTPNCQFR